MTPENPTTTAPAYRAGTQTGSLINLISSGSKMPAPVVGMGATILMWTDRVATTIVAVRTTKDGRPKEVDVVPDIATPLFEGMTDSQSYEYAPGDGAPEIFTLRRNGAWVRKGASISGTRLAIGRRDHYYDFSF